MVSMPTEKGVTFYMKLEFVPKFITLLAGAVVCIITIVKEMDVTYSLELLLATLIIFYMIGLIAKKIIQKVLEGNMFVRQDEPAVVNMDIPPQEEADTTEGNTQVETDEAGE